MCAKKVVCIGQEAFVLSPAGEIVRTMVAKLDGEGYQFLNGGDSHRPHWFIFKDAVAAASARIDARRKTLRKELRALARKRRTLETPGYRGDVMSAPYKVVELRDEMTVGFTMSHRTRKLKKVHVPETHLRPGHLVYAIITPATRPNPGWEVYRPYKHFVLETEVESVCFSPDGQVHYVFSTRFDVGEFFLSREEAIEKFRTYPEWAENGLVHCVTSKQEKEENEKLLDDNIPF